tara:strand:+ start:215 stop:670 length:456 start_codon:yes stop_codon:yes gene_type:complete
MEKKIYRRRRSMLKTLFSGILLTYVSTDNIFEGPLRILLKEYISLKEFGSDIREEGLYYLILIIGVSNIIIFLQSFIQPVIEINNGRVALRTKEKTLSVVRDIYEVKEIKKEEDKLLFIFEDGTYEVFTKNIKTEDADMVIDYIKNSKDET